MPWSHYRLLQSQDKSVVETEMKEKTFDYQNDKLEFVKNPIIAEFMELFANTDITVERKSNAYLKFLLIFTTELHII